FAPRACLPTGVSIGGLQGDQIAKLSNERSRETSARRSRTPLRIRLGRFQIPQKALKGLVIGRLLPPAAEVADVPSAANGGRPCPLRTHDRRIEADRKQHLPLLPLFALEASLDLVLNPTAAHRTFREYEQELVVVTNGVVDLLPELLPNLDVLRRVPAA